MAASYITTSLCLIATNYIYQFFCSHPDWGAATERAFFQGVALLAVGIVIALDRVR